MEKIGNFPIFKKEERIGSLYYRYISGGIRFEREPGGHMDWPDVISEFMEEEGEFCLLEKDKILLQEMIEGDLP